MNEGSVDGDVGSSSGLPRLMVLPDEGPLWQAVRAAVKQHHSLSLWKQLLWLFIHPSPTGLFSHCRSKRSTYYKSCTVLYCLIFYN